MTSIKRKFLEGSYLMFSNHLLTSFTHPISLLRDSGCLCFHLLCMKPSILSSFKIMVRWGYGPKSNRGGWRGQRNYIFSKKERSNFSNTILPSCGQKSYDLLKKLKIDIKIVITNEKKTYIENIRIYTPVCGVLSLYVAMPPHTAILPKDFICCKATVEKGPPTWN